MYVVDLHPEYQNGFQVTNAKSEGIGGIIVKVSEDNHWTAGDNSRRWAHTAHSLNMGVGVYHWVGDSTPENQLDNFLSTITYHGLEYATPIFDFEESSARFETLAELCQLFTRETNTRPVIYANGNYWLTNYGANRGVELGSRLWRPIYVTGASGSPAELYQRVDNRWWQAGYGGWEEVWLLQFTDKARVAGMTVDCSAFRGTVEDFMEKENVAMDIDTIANVASIIERGTWVNGYWKATAPDAFKSGGDFTLERIVNSLEDLKARVGDVSSLVSAIVPTLTEALKTLEIRPTDAQWDLLAENLSDAVGIPLDKDLSLVVTAAVKTALREGSDG